MDRTFDKDNPLMELESGHIERVEELAKIKQKQDEDKATARLHSITSNFIEGTISAVEKVEKMRSLRFISSAMKRQKAGQHDPSGYFHIEDMFCNDLRDPAARDYSEPIFDWLRNYKEGALERWECVAISGEPQKKNKALIRSEIQSL
ncbi:snRNA-activating protein complex [Cinnamomum micranthum f. kanehirae]|uniref:snRNA-activating protein complex n=1 Tax=Cinnamomum micranthum f. kanehirae TaxID=337451 RepID=A0A443Q3D6_9MAGN|nr:snRNA-activating protein complex [Cinnamomum micranthum f. kanehirae]